MMSTVCGVWIRYLGGMITLYFGPKWAGSGTQEATGPTSLLPRYFSVQPPSYDSKGVIELKQSGKLGKGGEKGECFLERFGGRARVG